MSVLLYINGQLLDLEPGQAIAQTKQVNDLNSVSNRQAGYTNKFKVPKTAHNCRVMQFLTLTGNTSGIPYQKNECSLYGQSGECFVYKGWAMVTDGGDNYEVVVYDGIIDLYKEIENKTLNYVGLEELTHDKNVQSVINSWGNQPYKYLVADYNGKNATETNTVDVDYLAPAVSVAWLWDKVFNTFNSTYSGSVFLTEAFKNLYLTFPKGLALDDVVNNVYSGNYFDYIVHYPCCYIRFSSDHQEGISSSDGVHFAFDEAGTYRIDLVGQITRTANVADGGIFYMGRNAAGLLARDVTVSQIVKQPMGPWQNNINFSFTGHFETMENICFVANWYNMYSNMQLKITKVSNLEYDFTKAFSDFGIRDFLTEIVHRFGLTMIKDKYRQHYRFLTLQEILQTNNNIDWSDKFVRKISENYIYGDYARQNWMRYTYNDKEASHNDGFITVNNENLQDKKDIIKSKIYSPEKGSQPIYKLWEKELNEDAEEGEEAITYKALDKRYYLLRSMPKYGSFTVQSTALNETSVSPVIHTGTFWKLSFSDIIQDYYGPLQNILQDSLLVTAELYLTEADIANFDFSRLYYIKQLSNYFMVNKITNYIPGKPVKCELVRVLYDPLPEERPKIYITKVITHNHDMRVFFDLNVQADIVNLQIFGYGTPGQWSNWTMGANHNPRYHNFTPTGTFRIRMEAAGHISNEIEVTIPATTPTTIYPND